jgi:hypothetical protein
MSAPGDAAGAGRDLAHSPGTRTPVAGDAFGAVGLVAVGLVARVGEKTTAPTHARFVCIHLRTLLLVVVQLSLTAITMVIVNPTVSPVNPK